jgi:putative methionine-R-sulfoxide reductase with GAF domain
MDHYSILDQNSPLPAPEPKSAAQRDGDSRASVPAGTASSLRFPAEDGGKSLSEMAQRDLNVALQLLAERAQYITGASGAAIALREGEELICRARAGPSAPEIGAQLQASGLTGESVRTREILRCNDATTDPRVDQQSCRTLGIASVMVMPLLHEQEVTGVFELLSDRTHAFEERDVIALQRLGEMIGTAIDHADAVKRGIQGVSAESSGEHDVSARGAAPEAGAGAVEAQPARKDPVPVPDHNAKPQNTDAMTESSPSPPETSAEAVRPMLANIGKCESCGFPVSGSRTLCLDCEAAQTSQQQAGGGSATAAPAFLAELGGAPGKSWLREHMYTIGIVLMVIFTAILLLWLRPS